MTRVLIYGAGRLGRQIVRHVHAHTDFEVLGFADDTRPVGETVCAGLEVLGGLRDLESDGMPERASLLMAIGYSDLAGRLRAFERARSTGWSFVGFVHPMASVEPSVVLGDGTVVLAGAVLDEGAALGHVNFVDANVTISEGCRFGDGNFVAAGSVFGGNVTVGCGTFVGLGATVVDGVSIGDRCAVNAGSLVHRSLESGGRLVEVPTQRILQGV